MPRVAQPVGKISPLAHHEHRVMMLGVGVKNHLHEQILHKQIWRSSLAAE